MKQTAGNFPAKNNPIVELNFKDVQVQLFYADGKPVKVGQALKTSDGETCNVTGGQAPHKTGSTGRVYVTFDSGKTSTGYFPSVFDMEWKPARTKFDDRKDGAATSKLTQLTSRLDKETASSPYEAGEALKWLTKALGEPTSKRKSQGWHFVDWVDESRVRLSVFLDAKNPGLNRLSFVTWDNGLFAEGTDFTAKTSGELVDKIQKYAAKELKPIQERVQLLVNLSRNPF